MVIRTVNDYTSRYGSVVFATLVLMMPPEMTYVCVNENCVWAGQERLTSMSSIAPGLYASVAPVYCECNPTVELKPKSREGEYFGKHRE